VSDFTHLSEVLAVAHRKWATGSYLWYPIKNREALDALARRLRKLAVPDILRCELAMGAERGGGLVGSGLLAVNPPFTLERDVHVPMPVLCPLLAPEAAARIDWLAKERAAGR
jgi:23S rRNA (adenine2030-N6)-methyltransferase